VVGPCHEPVGPCSQYELGGPGIPQVTTGGMLSGVPPGVYVTPDVALTHQYGNRESQMIPAGIPSGIPSGIYRTLVDVLGHPLVNRQLMTSQLVQTGNSQYSPDQSQVAHTDVKRYSFKIPAPVKSVRYFAPNTCSPVNAREPAPSYTQSQSQSEETCNSDERSEADSGIGYMSRPSQKSAVTGSRNAGMRTSFNDERCAYNSEVPANIVNTKGSSARMGAAELDASGSMGQRN